MSDMSKAKVIEPRPNRLAELRKRSRLTQQEVAKMLDIDFSTVSRHESHDRGLVKEEIHKYASLYKCDTIEIFFDPDEHQLAAT